MNYLALAQRLRRKCRVSGSGPTALSGESEEYSRLLDLVNEAWMEIQRMREDWKFLRASAACATVNGQVSYSATDFGLTDLGYWALDYQNGDTFRNYANPTFTITIASPGVVSMAAHGLANGDTFKPLTSGALPTGVTASTAYYVVNKTTDTLQLAATAGGTAINTTGTQSGTHTASSNNTTSFVGLLSEVFMPVRDYDSWRDAYQYGALRTSYTRPLVVAPTSGNAIACGPIAAAGYTLVGDYYKAPSELATLTEIPALATQFHMAIVYKAMMMYGASEAAPEVYDDGANEFDKIIREILRTQTRRTRMAGALA